MAVESPKAHGQNDGHAKGRENTKGFVELSSLLPVLMSVLIAA